MSARETIRFSDKPLTDREVELARRILSDSLSWPPEFMETIRSKLSNSPPYLTWDDVAGFDQAALRAAPAIPQVTLALSASGSNVDLPKATAPHAYYLLTPGGGNIRSLAEPSWEGARVTLKNSTLTSITLDHNDVSGGATARPFLFREGANVVLQPGESMEVAYVDTFWQDVARSAESGISKTIVDAKGDLIVATAADTVARRAVGSNGQVLTADSAESTGVKWATPAAPVIQSGVHSWGPLANDTGYETTITFPTAFTATPIVMATLGENGVALPVNWSGQWGYVRAITTTNFVLGIYNIPNGLNIAHRWLAIKP